MQLGNFIDVSLTRHVSGYIRPSSGTLDVELQHMGLCTELVDWWWSWEPFYGADGTVHHPHRTAALVITFI